MDITKLVNRLVKSEVARLMGLPPKRSEVKLPKAHTIAKMKSAHARAAKKK